MKTFIFLMLVLLSYSFLFCSQDSLLLAAPEWLDIEISEAVLREAYGQINIKITTIKIPMKRFLASAYSGEFDGTIECSISHDSLDCGFIQVSTPVDRHELVSFTLKKDIQISSWASLFPYRVGYLQGLDLLDRNVIALQVEKNSSAEPLFQMLKHDRLDIVIIEKIAGLKTLRQINLHDVKIIGNPFDVHNIYHYLSNAHPELAAQIEYSLRLMHHSGRLEEIRSSFIKDIGGGGK